MKSLPPKLQVGAAALLCLVTGILFASLARVEIPDPNAVQVWAQLAAPSRISSIAQSIVASENNLGRIDLRLNPSSAAGDVPAQTKIGLHPGAADSFASSIEIPLKGQTPNSNTLTLRFPPLATSRGQTYTLSLQRSTAGGRLMPVVASRDDWYADGSLVVDGSQRQGDLALRAFYQDRVAHVLWSGVQRAAGQLKLLLLLAALLVVPGFVLTSLLRRYGPWTGSQDPWVGAWQRLALCVTLSISLVVLLHAIAEMLGVPLRPQAAGAALAILTIVAVALIVGSLLQRRRRHQAAPVAQQSARRSDSGRTKSGKARPVKPVPGTEKSSGSTASALFGVISLLVFGAVFAVRLGQVHAISYPYWIDSVEHAQRVQAILTTGKTPPQFYHYAFHFLVADLAAWSGSSIADTMLLTGQVLSALVPVAVFSLAVFLLGNPWAGLASALVAGFATTMPAYYVSWGRYPFLLAWLLFPVVMVLVIHVLSDRTSRPATAVLAALAVCGLLLAHSRMGAFLLLLEGILLLQRLLQRQGWRDLLQWLGRALLVNGPALLLLALWTLYFVNRGAESMAIPEHASQRCLDPVGLSRRLSDATRGAPELAIYAVGIAGLLVASLQRKRVAWIVSAWLALAVVWPNLPAGVPGCALITNDVLAISMFLPVALGWGFAILALWSLLPSSSPRIVRSLALAIMAAVCIAIVLLGSVHMLTLLNPDTQLVRTADETAMAWARANLPPDAVFLVNSARWFRHRFHVSDGGSWIPFVTQQAVDYSSSFRIGQDLEETRITLENLCQELAPTKISYVFIGQRGGLITPQGLKANPSCFRQLYAQQGVSIFEITRATGVSP